MTKLSQPEVQKSLWAELAKIYGFVLALKAEYTGKYMIGFV